METPSKRIGQLLRSEIEEAGSISLERFMDVALYHPEHGYYCRGRKPIGVAGDYFTASQLQPAFGTLIRRYVERLMQEHRLTPARVFHEYGAGRGEMAECLSGWEYRAYEVHTPQEEAVLSGVVFGNELFDALPVRSAMRVGDRFRERRVAWDGTRFVWTSGERGSDEIAEYAALAGVPALEGFVFEVHQRSVRFLERLLAKAEETLCVFVDYGYSQRDWRRFPDGTLMAYRKHRAEEDVLAEPGERDITSHVPFHLLEGVAKRAGARVLRMERLASALLYAGEPDEFACVLQGQGELEMLERRQQLKSLLYGFGEGFHVIAIAK